MKIPASEFKARCLALIDEVNETGEPITITKRGRVVAQLTAAGDVDERPWLKVRGKARWNGDPLDPVIGEHEIDAAR
ncbi:MAG TPA: type II toxin-antitoxin system Phd/YefM family antitoxin [Thermoanaerobaculia bacterium]